VKVGGKYYSELLAEGGHSEFRKIVNISVLHKGICAKFGRKRYHYSEMPA